MVSVSGLDGVWLGLEVLLFGVCGVNVGCLIVVRLGVLGCWFGSFPVGCFLGLVLCWAVSVVLVWAGAIRGFWCLCGFWVLRGLFRQLWVWVDFWWVCVLVSRLFWLVGGSPRRCGFVVWFLGFDDDCV